MIRYRGLLHGLFPSQHDIDILVSATPGPKFLVSKFYPFRRILEGSAEPSHEVNHDPANIQPPIGACETAPPDLHLHAADPARV